jgi:hypothetical protein
MSCEGLKTIQNELKALIDNNNTTSEEYENFYKRYGIPLSNKVESELIKTCDEINIQGGTNIIKILPSCVKTTEELCMAIHNVPREIIDGDPRLIPWQFIDCYEKYGPYANFNEQRNFSSIKSICKVNTILNDPELNNNKEMAIVVAMILADQEIKCNPNDNESYFYKFGTKEKISSISKCVNSALSSQLNYLDGCRFSNKRQTNINDLINNCIINTTIGKPTNTTTPSVSSPDYVPPDISQYIPPSRSTIFSNTSTTPSNINTTTPAPIKTTTPAPIDNTQNMIIVVVIILAAIFIGYFFF